MEGLCDLARYSFEGCRSAKGHVEGACEVEFAVLLEMFHQVEGTFERSEACRKCRSAWDEFAFLQGFADMARAYGRISNAYEL